MTIENESKKNRNAVLLNILLYIVSLLGAVGTLETLESKLNIPFKCSFIVVILVFPILGVIFGALLSGGASFRKYDTCSSTIKKDEQRRSY